MSANTFHIPPPSATNVIVLGSGESGVGAAILAKQQGYTVFVSDGGKIKEQYKAELEHYGIEYEDGKHTVERILAAQLVIKSPGIPEKNELVKALRAKGIAIISEIELAFWFKGQSKIVAITGSNGKSTTTNLIYHILKTAGVSCALVGNIGYSFAKQVAEDPKEWYVVEVSSFQLDDIDQFQPDVALLLNITEDHLDRYNYQFENYINSKFRILKNQNSAQYFIYNYDDPVIQAYLENTSVSHTNLLPFSMKQEFKKGAYIKGDTLTIRASEERVSMSINDFAIKGKHNQANTMAAGIAAHVMGIRKEKIREAVSTIQTLEHRAEYVATVRGVDFINDSKATNVNSTWYALESMQKPTVLILGGVDKGNDYSALYDLVKTKVKAIVCLGIDNQKIIEAFKGIVNTIVDTNNIETCVATAFKLATKGDTVLLSPACASFDLFKNFEERGQLFKKAVKDL